MSEGKLQPHYFTDGAENTFPTSPPISDRPWAFMLTRYPILGHYSTFCAMWRSKRQHPRSLCVPLFPPPVMEVLAYLIEDLQPETPKLGTDRTTRILRGSRSTEQCDEEHLQIFSEETFGALRKNLPFLWHDDEVYDTVNPFGDRRQTQFHALWKFDTRRDLLYYNNWRYRSLMSLSLLRNRVVSMADMEFLGGPVPNSLPLKPERYVKEAYWKPKIEIDRRLRAFLHRVFRDFHFQWRHIFRNHFNFTTLRVFAAAVIRLATLDFEVSENTKGASHRGAHVWITQLPTWDPVETEIRCVGSVHLVLCQDIEEGLTKAKRHLSPQGSNAAESPDAMEAIEAMDDQNLQASCVILSVKQIMLCHIAESSSLINTAPQPLFNGDHGSGSPSELAMDFLIWAMASARPLIVTPLQSLPTEVQDMTLEHAAIGKVGSAKLGCLLGSGTPFSWRDGPEEVTLATHRLNRPEGGSVESHIWFGEHKSGVVYLLKGPKVHIV
nr:hypothetical protein CFP56_11950 [Quercus suber]